MAATCRRCRCWSRLCRRSRLGPRRLGEFDKARRPGTRDSERAGRKTSGCRSALDAFEQSFRLKILQELPVSTASKRGPWFETSLPVKLVREIDIRFAIQKVSKIQSGPFQVHRVDLKVTPIERAVGVVMVDLACAARILGTLYCQGNAAIRPEFVTRVLLVRGQVSTELVASNGIRLHP
jgi:hypothetical protein